MGVYERWVEDIRGFGWSLFAGGANTPSVARVVAVLKWLEVAMIYGGLDVRMVFFRDSWVSKKQCDRTGL